LRANAAIAATDWSNFMLFKISGNRFLSNPAKAISAMQAEGPLVRVKLPILGKMWATTTDEATRKLLKETTLFVRNIKASTGKPLDRVFWWMPRALRTLTINLLMQDGPEHARLRGMVEEAFARVAVDGLTGDITAIADRLLDRLDADKPVDIISGYSRELPFEVICAMLGIPEAERPYLVQRLKPISSAGSIPSALWAMARMAPLVRRMRGYYHGGAREITTGLAGALNAGGADGSRLTEDEFVAMVFMLFVAGHETTVHLINNALLALTERPDLRHHFRAMPDDIPIFVEEVMRYASPVMMTKMLFVRQDCEFMGVSLRKGEMVTGLLIAANHDPARFSTPETLIPDRRPNPQLGFGFGPHVCLGMQLARAEARIAIERLLARFDTVETAAPVVWSGRVGIHGPKTLMLRLRP